MTKKINYPMLFLGIIAAGGVFTGTNPSYTEFEILHHMKTAKASFLITEPEIMENALKAAKSRGIPQSRIWVLDSLDQTVPAGFQSWSSLMAHGEKDWVRFDDEVR